MASQDWSVDVVYVTSRDKQQEVLKLFTGVAGITAMGTSTAGDHYVVIGTVDNLMKSAAKVLISDIDPDAVLTYNSDARPRGRAGPGYPCGPWAESQS